MYKYPQRANIQLQGLNRHAVIVGAIQVPTAKLEFSFGTISPDVDLHCRQKALW